MTKKEEVPRLSATANDEVLEAELNQVETAKLGCGILGRYPIISLLCFVAAGIGVGIGLSMWNPSDPESKANALQWIGLIGVLFLRALKAIVLPIVFVNVVIAVADMMMVGSAGGIGGRTIAFYFATTLLAGMWGAIFSALFSRWFATEPDAGDTGPTFITLGCSEAGSFLTQGTDGNVTCSSDYLSEEDILWVFGDYNSSFSMVDGTVVDEVSLSDTIYDGIFIKLVTDNIFFSFWEANFVAVVMFAIAMGIACAQVMSRTGVTKDSMPFLGLMVNLDQILSIMIIWVIMCTPFAVFSMIASAIGAQDNIGEVFINVALLVCCTIIAFCFQYFLVYCGLFYYYTRTNPFPYLKCLFPAQLMALSCSSSAATLPITIECVRSTGVVPDTILKFVLPLGATVNMDGTAIYFPIACVWMAVYNGITPNVGQYILLVIISAFGSMGAAPIPNAALALIITSYNTVFNNVGIPDGFSFIFAVDWLLDRMQTALNVTGDCIVAGIIAHICPLEDETDDDDAEKAVDPTTPTARNESGSVDLWVSKCSDDGETGSVDISS